MDTGNIKINDVNASTIDLKTSTGIHTLTNVTASSNIYLKQIQVLLILQVLELLI